MTETARYRIAGPGPRAADEVVEISEDDGRLAAACRLAWEGASGRSRAVLNAGADGAVESLELETQEKGVVLEARYGWQGDAWVGRIRPGRGAAVESSWPLCQGLQLSFPSALSDLLLLRRLALEPHSQRRMELLELDLSSLQTAPGHVMADRMGRDEARGPWGACPADRYRLTDAQGSTAELQVSADGWLLERRGPGEWVWTMLQRSGAR